MASDFDCDTSTTKTDWISLRLSEEFRNEVENKRRRLLSNIIIEWTIQRLALNDSVGAIILVTLFLAATLFLLTTLISFLFNHSLPELAYSALVSFLTAFSFGIIKFLDHNTFSSSSNDFPRNLKSYVSDNQSLINLISWLRSYVSLTKQLVVSFAVAVGGTLSIFFIAQTRSIDLKIGSYILLFLCLVGVGQGAYCAVVIPTLAREISKQRLELFWFKPADSPWIHDASAFFTKLSMADALIVLLGICGVFLLKPFESTKTAWVAGGWLVIGILVLSYTFLFPHRYLTQVIRKEKKRQIEYLQSLITSYEIRIEQLNADEYKRLLDHINLYNFLSGSRDNSIDIETWLKYVSSLGVPILAFAGGLVAKRLGLS